MDANTFIYSDLLVKSRQRSLIQEARRHALLKQAKESARLPQPRRSVAAAASPRRPRRTWPLGRRDHSGPRGSEKPTRGVGGTR